ncbi:hypothetical protein ACHAXM_003242, partial [Skeletonema potamos]
GVCCVSMKVVVFIDLIATMILPASYCYAMYLLFLVFVEDLPVSKVLLILYGIIMGVQVVVFILRSRWEYLWWFTVYFVVGLPVFYLILPVYSFWNMDDFSWGKTRAVGGSAANNGLSEDDDENSEDDEKDRLVKEGDDDDSSTSSSSRTNSEEDEESDYDDNNSQGQSDYDNEAADRDDESEYSEENSETQAESQYYSQTSRMEQSRRSRTML